MMRSGYSDDAGEWWPHIMYRGQVASAIRGKRGQAFLRALAEALDALPEKKLIAHNLQCDDGVCAIGSVGLRKGIDMSDLDPEDAHSIADRFGITHQLVREIESINDDDFGYGMTPEKRWSEVRAWVARNLKGDAPATND